jgi:hypothetical protein
VSLSPSASASPSTSPSPSSSPRQRLTLQAVTPSISAGTSATLSATGAANQAYSLQCYSRPSTTYTEARNGAFDSAGNPVSFTLNLGRNTRCFLQYVTNSSDGQSDSAVVNVRTVLSLGAVRGNAPRTYVFQGRNLPRLAGQLITLYRVNADGSEVRTANLRTDASGIYRLTRSFSGTGAFQFRVRTPQTLSNAAGVSNTILVRIR